MAEKLGWDGIMGRGGDDMLVQKSHITESIHVLARTSGIFFLFWLATLVTLSSYQIAL